MILGPKSKSYKDSLKIRFLETIFTSETGILSGVKTVDHRQVIKHFLKIINFEFIILIVISVISLILILGIMNYHYNKSTKKYHRFHLTDLLYQLLLQPFLAVLTYGLDFIKLIDTSSSRILIGSYKIGYLLVIWCLLSVYGADLIIGRRKIVIDSYTDLAERADVIPIIPHGGNNLEIYKNADADSRAGQIWNRRLKGYEKISKEILFEKIVKQQIAIVDNEDRLDSLFMKICAKNDTYYNPQLWISRRTFFVSNFAMAVSYKMPDSKVRRLNRIIRDIVSSGLIDKWYVSIEKQNIFQI